VSAARQEANVRAVAWAAAPTPLRVARKAAETQSPCVASRADQVGRPLAAAHKSCVWRHRHQL
jgi:hypothetical protein